MKKIHWVSAGGIAVLAGLAYYGLRPPPPQAQVRIPFDGVRSRASGVTYSQQDPATGSTLIVRARVAVTRDGRVGQLFRSPLRPEVELTEVEAELLDSGENRVITARSEAALYDPEKGGVTLDQVSTMSVGDRQIRTERLVLHPDGRAEIPGAYDVKRGSGLLGRGMGFSGKATEIGMRKTVGKTP